ncbi:MAG: hypothetical protein ABW116_08545 [Candidatus Sedimenticola sp. 20ELBAFRAG]
MSKSLTIDFNANVARFSSALDKATQDLNKFQSNTSRVANNASKAFGGMGKAVAGALSTAGFAALTKHALDYADGIADASEKTGFTVKRLQELRFASDQMGVSITELEGGLGRFTKRLGLARMGTGAAADTYKKLGIDLKQTNEQVFMQAVETLGSMESETNRLALVTRLFGDDAQRLGVLFQDGNEGLERFANKAHELGLVLSDDLVQGASDANDQLAIMKSVINIQTVQVFNSLAPVITQVGQAFADAAPKVARFFDSFKDIENQSLETLEDTAREAQQKYLGWLEKKEDYLSVPTHLRSLDVIGYGEGIDKELNAWKARFESAINQIRKIRERAAGDSSSGTTPNAADLSGLFNHINEGAREAAAGVVVLRDDMDDILDIYEQEEKANAKLWSRHEAGIVKAAKGTQDLKRESTDLDDSWRDLGLTFSSAFEDAIVEGEKLSDVLRGLAQDILRVMARKTVTEPLGNLLSGGLGDLFGFANGGSFMVGGNGGTDSQLVAFKASPNERVTIETPSQQRGGGGGLAVSIGHIDARGSTDPAQTEAAVFRAVRLAVNESVATMRDLKARGSLPEFA